jgi:replicative DNA helicase
MVPPHNLDAERSELGALLLDSRPLTGMVLEVGLTAEDFYREQFDAVFGAICQLAGANEPIDELTVAAQLERHGALERVGGAEAVERLTGWIPAAGHSVQYAQIVREHAQLRRLLTATYEIQASVFSRQGDSGEELIDAAEQTIFALRGRAVGQPPAAAGRRGRGGDRTARARCRRPASAAGPVNRAR